MKNWTERKQIYHSFIVNQIKRLYNYLSISLFITRSRKLGGSDPTNWQNSNFPFLKYHWASKIVHN